MNCPKCNDTGWRNTSYAHVEFGGATYSIPADTSPCSCPTGVAAHKALITPVHFINRYDRYVALAKACERYIISVNEHHPDDRPYPSEIESALAALEAE